MKVLLTGGSGNLGQTLVPKLLDKGDTPAVLDVRAPPHLNKGAVFIEGSVLDRSKLTEIFRGCDKQSGIGREFSVEGMLGSFTQRKNVTVNLNTPHRQ